MNPEDAYYCYHDGRLLSGEGNRGPMQIGFAPFVTPFYFADGQACANFNQLAMTCDTRWEESRSLLAQGVWPTFFGGIGRFDLAAAANQAAADPDLDRGLSSLLAKLPADADALKPPKLALDSTEENLGQLAPGFDLTFELVIRNKGMLLLHGMASSSCDWLVFGERNGPPQKMFQTRNACALLVRVLGNKLRAGRKPLHGEIVVDSNGGTLTVSVSANVPIQPFPQGLSANNALAGAKSPREIAVKAKANPNEAATLFAHGAVKAWYASNGWVYPIEGSEGSGKGAVQQFFEALGLTKPPRLEINTTSFILKGKVGTRLSRRVTVRTEDAKPVFAHASSNQPWVTFGPVKYMGNKVEIRIDVTVPPYPEQIVQAQVTIEGNGKQRFGVALSVAIEAGRAVEVDEDDFDEDVQAADDYDEPTSFGDWLTRLWK